MSEEAEEDNRMQLRDGGAWREWLTCLAGPLPWGTCRQREPGGPWALGAAQSPRVWTSGLLRGQSSQDP